MSHRQRLSLAVAVALPLLGVLPAAAQNQHDMTFHTVPPCTVVDTRVAGGAFAASETRTYNVVGSGSLASQGGSSSGCTIPGFSNNVAQVQAVELAVTTTSTAGPGFMIINAADQPLLGAVINMTNGIDLTNTTAVAVAQTSGVGDIKVVAGVSGTHLILRVVGYYSKPVQTVWVHPVPGNATASGTALLNAVGGISNASATKRYVVKLEPGIYDVGTGTTPTASLVQMKQYVDIEGSGQQATIIQGPGSNDNSFAVVQLASNSELRNLKVVSTGVSGQSYALPIFATGTSNNSVSDVTVAASGAPTVYGIRLNGSSPAISGLAISVQGGSSLTEGIVVRSLSNPKIRSARISVAPSSGDGYGIVVTNSAYPLEVDDVHVDVNGGSALYGYYQDSSGSAIRISNSTFLISNATTSSRGIYFRSSDLVLSHAVARASGGTSYGVDGPVHADNCEIAGETATVLSSFGFIGGSKLDGGAVSGTVTCAGVWDESYTFYASTCP
jgi:hypothetical protein